METLLCRRVDLVSASGRLPLEADAAVQDHLSTCQRCQEAVRLDRDIAESLRRTRATLGQEARRRIDALVHVRASEQRSTAAPDWLGVAAGVAALLLIVCGLARGPVSRVGAPPDAPEPASDTPAEPVVYAGEHISGLGELLSRHRGGDQSGSSLPAAALLYESRLPRGLAEQLLLYGPDETDHAAWDGHPTVPAVDEATLFVLARNRIRLDPVVADVLEDYGTLTFPHGPHQVTLSGRDGKLFVIIASPAGIEAVAGAPWL